MFFTFSIFIFTANSIVMLLIGIIMWGIGMGALESILKACVASMVNKSFRATGYGMFEFSFGIFWFLDSFLTGYLYDHSFLTMIIISCLSQLLSIPFYLLSSYKGRKEKSSKQSNDASNNIAEKQKID